ncbi:MAG: aldo/keto reductase [Spirochaetales bacterium]|nr:aldo/keto reductase [Spirochaetales bacterium]
MKNESRLEKKIGKLNPFSFGTWALGGEYWGEQSHKDTVRALHRALSLGVRHFDTAPVYGKGRSEQILGQQLRKIRSDVTLGTKVFYSDPQRMVQSFHTSLKRLMTDYIDIFYIHWPLSDCDMRPGMAALEALRREGRIRAIGVSNFSEDQIRNIGEAGDVDVFQGGYNLFWPRLEQELLPYLNKNKIGFIPYGVLAQGILTETGPAHLNSVHEGFRHKMVLYDPALKETISGLLEKALEECRKNGIPLEQAVSSFTLIRLCADTVLLGARNRDQADRNFQPAVKTLPEGVVSVFEELLEKSSAFLPDCPNLFNHIS